LLDSISNQISIANPKDDRQSVEKQNAEAQNAYTESKQVYLDCIQQYEHNALVNSDVQLTFLPILEDKLQLAKVSFPLIHHQTLRLQLFYIFFS